MTAFHLGINTCFAVKRWPRPRDWAAVIADEFGLTRCQLSLDLLPIGYDIRPAQQYVEDAADACERFGISIDGLFTGLAAYSSNLLADPEPSARDAAERWYCSIIDLASSVSIRSVGGHVGARSIATAADVAADREILHNQLDAMRRIADYAANQGLEELLFENLAVSREYGHLISEAQHVEAALADASIPWTLCLDLGHAATLTTGTTSDDPFAWLSAPWIKTPVLQLQHAVRGMDLHAPFTSDGRDTIAISPGAVRKATSHRAGADWFAYLEVIPAHEQDDAQVLKDLRESTGYWETRSR